MTGPVAPAAHARLDGAAVPGAPAGSGAGPVCPSGGAGVRLRPLPLSSVAIDGGLWAARQRVNRERSLPAGARRLRDAGNVANLQRAAAVLRGSVRASGASAGGSPSLSHPDYHGPLFMDSDVYKWLEAAAWEHGREPSAALVDEIATLSEVVAAAQAPDGYLNSFVQVTRGGADRYADLSMGHEQYCLGHLFQAGVAARRTVGDTALWDVVRRAANHLVATFGPNGNTGLDGHPVVEMALVELYRESGDARYLDLAAHFVETRGRGTIKGYGREPIYFSDRVPVRRADSPEGHAVRAVYLAAGAADVALEGRDEDGALGAALDRQWRAMVEAKQYVTGGLGSRWDGEAFGDPYELPPDVAYAETCASIGAVQWAWRRLLATGDVTYADGIERLLLNGFLSGVSLSGEEYFYVNALQVRTDAVPHDHRHPVNGRRPWFQTACCPPNIMRTVAQVGGYLATGDADGIQLQQYAASTVRAGNRWLRVSTDYPWDGTVTVSVEQSDAAEWTLSMRVPAWCEDATLTTPDEGTRPVGPGYADITRAWAAGDRVELALPLPVRLTEAAPRVDAVRGCRAVERGPLVYAVEQVDLPSSVAVDDLRLPSDDPTALRAHWRPDLLGGCVVVEGSAEDAGGSPVPMTAVPYCLWANRAVGPMRVWLPVRQR